MTMSAPPEPSISYAFPVTNNQDLEHLKILAICHWVWGGLTMLFSCMFIVHIVMGIAMLNGGFGQGTSPNNQAPEFVGWMFVIMGSAAITIGWVMGALTIWSGFNLRKHRRRVASMVIGGIGCISMPVGTVLGIFTIIVLSRPSVKQLYANDGH